ncbi:hydroxyacid dehydrogenase [Methylovirgula sp. 4M-Z18]|uniref:hydroxyacid dehydrogenase n=1 Tax=Methylovirgula sp. 4M-Z18 TaxID=2293567 RepID=UPI000E2F9ED4|nr:hydroxyacid dehydrogenase [Methylovirgula sp. 4M-Z18]RFB80736.1 3-phosphoglycerate dehydrogenase [Methylovirgula sp. 4M-Z18]
MPHLLIAGKLHPAGIALLKSANGFTYDYVEESSEPSYAPLIGKADALVIRTQPLSAPTIAEAARLQIVSRHGVGYDSVDVAALNARRIPLCVVGDVNSQSVAEHAMMLILACAKQLIRADNAVRNGAWGWRNRLEAGDISGKRLLIIGYGRIGHHLAQMAEGFKMDIRAFDPFLAERGWPEGPVRPAATLAEGLAWADIVSVHMPKAGAPLLGAKEFTRLKQGAIVVNTARGGIVDEGALTAALADGRIAAAGLDVFDDEPPKQDHPLLAFDQVAHTPHIAGLTQQAAERMAVSSIQNVFDFFAGRLDRDLIVNGNF